MSTTIEPRPLRRATVVRHNSSTPSITFGVEGAEVSGVAAGEELSVFADDDRVYFTRDADAPTIPEDAVAAGTRKVGDRTAPSQSIYATIPRDAVERVGIAIDDAVLISVADGLFTVEPW